MNRSDDVLSLTQQTYIGIGLATSSLSLIGCLLIICTYLTIKKLRTTGRKILLYLSLANIGVCVGTFIAYGSVIEYIIPSWHWYSLCAVAACISVVFRLSSYLWTTALGVYLYMSLSWRRMSIAGKLLIPFHIVCWTFPVAVMGAALASGAVGFNQGVSSKQIRPPYCYVDSTRAAYITWSFVAGMGWQVGAVIICFLSYLLIQLSLLREKRKKEVDESTEELLLTIHTANIKLRHVLILFVFISIPGIWHFMSTFYTASPEWLFILAVIGDNSQGFVNAVFFCFLTKKVRRTLCSKIRSKLKKCLCSRRPVKRGADLAGIKLGSEGENLVQMQEMELWDDNAPDDNVLWQQKKKEKEVYC